MLQQAAGLLNGEGGSSAEVCAMCPLPRCPIWLLSKYVRDAQPSGPPQLHNGCRHWCMACSCPYPKEIAVPVPQGSPHPRTCTVCWSMLWQISNVGAEGCARRSNTQHNSWNMSCTRTQQMDLDEDELRLGDVALCHA